MNENIKGEFISGLTGSYQKLATWVFETYKTFEDQYGKDACDFTEKDIYNSLRTLNISSIQSLESRVSLLRKYTDWCIARNINRDHINHYDMIDRNDLIAQCLNEIKDRNEIFSREDVLEFSNVADRASDAYMILAAFEGIGSRSYSEMAYLKDSQIDAVNKVVALEGLILPVSSELCTVAFESINCYEYENSDGKKFYFEDTADYAIKPMRGRIYNSEEFIREKLNKRYRKMQDTIDGRITFTNLKKSGIIYSMRKCMDENGLSFDEMLLSKQFEEIKARYDLWSRPDFKLRANYKNYFTERG